MGYYTNVFVFVVKYVFKCMSILQLVSIVTFSVPCTLKGIICCRYIWSQQQLIRNRKILQTESLLISERSLKIHWAFGRFFILMFASNLQFSVYYPRAINDLKGMWGLLSIWLIADDHSDINNYSAKRGLYGWLSA